MSGQDLVSQLRERNRLHALANGIPMDHVEWDCSETKRLYGYIDRKRRQDGFPVFIVCGELEDSE